MPRPHRNVPRAGSGVERIDPHRCSVAAYPTHVYKQCRKQAVCHPSDKTESSDVFTEELENTDVSRSALQSERISPSQSCPWVGLTRGLGWVGLGREWVENLCFSGLGWVMGLK